MFRLPIIGVSACARTNGHALSLLVAKVSMRFIRADLAGLPSIAETRQRPSPAASAPFSVFPRIVHSFFLSHHNAGSALPLRCVRLGPCSAVQNRHERVVKFAPGLELDASRFSGGGDEFSSSGVKSQVPEVRHPE